MGNALNGCISHKEVRQKASSRGSLDPPLTVSNSKGKHGFLPSLPRKSSSSSKKEGDIDDDYDADLVEQAVAAAMLFRHHQTNGSLPFPRSKSVAYPSSHNNNKKKKQQHQGLTKSSSSRQPSPADPFMSPTHLVSQDAKVDEHFILVHGGGFGAWCWYKIIMLLQESGYKVDAVNLTGSGTNSSDTNTVTTLAQYTKPLIDILNNLKQGQKVILVGHDIGGACLSYVMELFPSKIAKSIFISATMPCNGQSALHILSQQTEYSDLMRQAQVFLYANGKDKPPTAIHLNKQFLRELLFNQSSSKDIALALVSMREIPFSAITEKVCVSEEKYGSIPRFYIKIEEDCGIPASLQEQIIKSNPPKQVFLLKGSDHAPFFSKPHALHRMLLQISQIN